MQIDNFQDLFGFFFLKLTAPGYIRLTGIKSDTTVKSDTYSFDVGCKFDSEIRMQ